MAYMMLSASSVWREPGPLARPAAAARMQRPRPCSIAEVERYMLGIPEA